MSIKMLMAFCDVVDLWKNEERLYEAIVRKLHKQGILGATVLQGVMGYGVHRRIHKKGLLGVSDERPIVILAIDEEEKLRAAVTVAAPWFSRRNRSDWRINGSRRRWSRFRQ